MMSAARPSGASKSDGSASKRRAKVAPAPPEAVPSASPSAETLPAPLPSAAPAPPARTYSVTLVLANDGAGGDSTYVLDLTEPDILRLLSDDETPRYVRLPKVYSQHVPGVETRWVRMSNIAEIHVSGWTPPAALEWFGPDTERAPNARRP